MALHLKTFPAKRAGIFDEDMYEYEIHHAMGMAHLFLKTKMLMVVEMFKNSKDLSDGTMPYWIHIYFGYQKEYKDKKFIGWFDDGRIYTDPDFEY